METIFKEGYGKIMRVFYKNKALKIHLRGLARETNLNENSITRFLKQLETRDILQSEKEGNLKNYSIQKNEKTFIFFAMFDIKRFSELPSLRKNAINIFLDSLKEKPLITVLFGSTAKENFTKESDVDLLLIVNRKIQTKDAEDYADAQTGIRINCFQVEYKNFSKELKLKEDFTIQSAINSGYPLTNYMLYYSLVLT